MRASVLGSIALAGALSVVAAACGSGGGSGEDADLVAAIETAIEADPFDFDGAELDTTCMAESLVDAMGGASRAEERYGVTVEVAEDDPDFDLDLERADAESFADSFWECGDMMQAMIIGMTDEGASEEDASCVVDNLDEDIVKQGLAIETMGDEGASLVDENDQRLFDSMLDAMAACDVSLDSFG